MGLDTLIRSGIATANRITGSIQVNVQHEAWIASGSGTGFAVPQYAPAVLRPALVEMRQGLFRDTQGKEVLQRAKVTFLAPIDPNGATGRREPIDPRDRITLPDGTTGPILDVSGLADPQTGRPYMFEVPLGWSGLA